MKPAGLAGLANTCSRCDKLIPYDPQARNQYCNSCNRAIAFGEPLVLDNSQDMIENESQHSYSIDAFQVSTEQVNPVANHQNSYTDMPRPNKVPAGQMSGFKRTHKEYMTEEPTMDYPNKRFNGNTDNVFETPSFPRNAMPPTFDQGGETEDEDAEFVDAQEDQGVDSKAVMQGAESGGEKGAKGEGDEAYGMPEKHESVGAAEMEGEVDEEVEMPRKHESASLDQRDEGEGDSRGVQEEVHKHEHEVDDQPADAQPDEDDLFEKVFGGAATSKAAKDDDDDGDSEEIQLEDFNQSTFIASLRSSSTTQKAPNTTLTKDGKPKRKPFTPNHVLGPIAPEIPRHFGFNLKRQYTFHIAATEWVPRLPLAEHRYWIGVLKNGVPPRATQTEKSFVWMKGNRLTTVATVWHAYCNGAAEAEPEHVVLLLGYEKPKMTVRCEELDYFTDRRIIFRAVRASHKDAAGRGLCEEVIRMREPEALPEAGDVQAEGGGGEGKAVDVIEID